MYKQDLAFNNQQGLIFHEQNQLLVKTFICKQIINIK